MGVGQFVSQAANKVGQKAAQGVERAATEVVSNEAADMSNKYMGKIASGLSGVAAANTYAAKQDVRAAEIAAHPEAPERDYKNAFSSDPGSHSSDPGLLRVIIATILMVVYDFADLALDVSTGMIANVLEFVVNILFQTFLGKLLGIYAGGVAGFLSWLEVVPIVDSLPLYTIAAVAVWFKYLTHFITRGDKTPSVGGHQKISIFLHTKHGKWILLIVFFLIAGVIGALMNQQVAESFAESVGDFRTFLGTEGGVESVFNMIFGKIFGFFDAISNRIDEQINIATGQQRAFEGSVDSARNLGLTANFAESQNTDFYPDQKIFLTGTVQGADLPVTICDDTGISCVKERLVKVWCADQNGKRVPTNEKTPHYELDFDILEGATIDVGCDFGEPVFDSDKERILKKVFFNAEFQFLSAGYYTVPFVTSSKKTELDALDVTFPKHSPKFTPGPIEIRFDAYDDPLQVYEEKALNTRALSFSILNSGDGTVSGIDAFGVIFPQGVTPLQCQGLTERTLVNNRYVYTEGTGEGAYDLSSVVIPPKKSQDFTCLIELTPEVIQMNFDVSEDSFQVLADYRYRSTESKSITLIKERFKTLKCGDTCSSQTGCTCPAECSGTEVLLVQGQVCSKIE